MHISSVTFLFTRLGASLRRSINETGEKFLVYLINHLRQKNKTKQEEVISCLKQSISRTCGFKRVTGSQACLHGVDHFLSEAVGEENVVDFHGETVGLAARHVHGDLQRHKTRGYRRIV